jgi:DNA-binding NarL/FixJ family response regulator
MGGKEAGQKLRAENPGLKLIVSSGYVADPALADPTSQGFAAAIPKPYAAEVLSKVVANVLAQRP